MGFLASIFSGGTMQAVTDIATEWIDTDKGTAEAKSLFIKTLDPNGSMRRYLSIFASRAYGFYLVTTVILIFMSVWGVGGDTCTTIIETGINACKPNADIAAGRMTELFLPITGSWAAITSASFGVNGVNSYKGRP
jgi:hypothetical protein